MLKKKLPFLFLPLLLAGCTATFTNLTPKTQTRNAENLYPVEVELSTKQQTMRWDTIKPQIVVGDEFFPMRPTSLMSNRWEGLVPVPAHANETTYHYKFDYLYNAFGPPRPDSASSPEYKLRIQEEKK
jgi:hypothetical protein